MAQFQPAVNNSSIQVDVYEPMAACADLSALTPDSIVPTFLHMLFACSNLDIDSANSKFRSIEFVATPQPTTLAQDTTYDTSLAHVFVYIASLIPKNATATLTKHLAMKELGIIRAIQELNLIGQPGKYQIDMGALASLQDFMNRHTDVMSLTFETFLGITNVRARHVAYSYAQELLPALYYSNMISVKIIEESLLAVNHPCLVNGIVRGALTEYYSFKRMAQTKYGIHWRMCALLDKDSWNIFSRTRSHIRLYVIAAMFGSDEISSYESITIEGNKVSHYKTNDPYFSKIYSTYGNNSQSFTHFSGPFSKSEASIIRKRANKYQAIDNFGQSLVNSDSSDED